MAVTVFRIDGFEHGQLTGPGGYSNISNATISTTTVRSGARSMRFNATAAAATARLQGLLTGQRRFALTFYIRFATLPDADWAIFSAGGSLGGSFGWDVTSGKFCFKVGGTDTVMGSVVATGQWYRIVWELDQTADPAVARVTIDNGSENTLNTTPITPADLTDFFWGQAATNRTLDCFIDDAVWSVTDGDYEQLRDDWSNQAIESIIPSSDGTHNITTSGDFDSFTGTAFSNSTTNGNTFIGHRPMQFANTADQVIRQELGTTANYMEFGMENHTLSGTPIAAKTMTARVDSASAGANSAEMQLLLSDNTEVLTTGSISAWNSTEDPSNVVSARTRMTIDPSGGWDNTKIDGLKARVGFGDNAPDANFIDFMVELLYVGKDITGVALTVTPSLPAGEVTTSGAGQTVDGVALSVTPTLPVGTLNHSITGVALSATPSLPAGALTHSLTGVTLSATPTLPVGALTHTVTGVALVATPTLPVGEITAAGATVTGVALSAEPSLPAGALTHTLTGTALSAAPTLPVATLNHSVTGVALGITPVLPVGALQHSITGVVLSANPVLPVGVIQVPQTVTGVVLDLAPALPIGAVTVPAVVVPSTPLITPAQVTIIRLFPPDGQPIP